MPFLETVSAGKDPILWEAPQTLRNLEAGAYGAGGFRKTGV